MAIAPEDLERAVEHYRAGRAKEAVALAPAHEIANALGTEHAKRGEHAEAERRYREAIALAPGFFKPHNNLGNVLRERGELEAAVAAYVEALRIEPSAHRVHANLGNTLADLGRKAEAADAYRKALDLSESAPVAMRLAKVLEDLGDRGGALTAYVRARKLGDAAAAAEIARVQAAVPPARDPARDPRATLLHLTDIIGSVFGTEDFSMFLYSLVRMQRPATIVELGTGLGASALAMALAARLSGECHVFTIDDLSAFSDHPTLLAGLAQKLRAAGFPPVDTATPERYFADTARVLGVTDHVTFLHRAMDLDDPACFDDYPFAGRPIDLLFADFAHGPADVLAVLGQFLPRMAPASSIMIDSASTTWPSYLLLEQLVAQLDRGQIPLALQERARVDLAPVLRNRRAVLMHLTERKDRAQNSTAWLKLEPVDLLPQPRTAMHL